MYHQFFEPLELQSDEMVSILTIKIDYLLPINVFQLDIT
ncbi:hypothetical protein M2326_003104 [Flavobacterium sp. 7A]|nr:hypothetical protein [Flavobacterium sp. 7A]